MPQRPNKQVRSVESQKCHIHSFVYNIAIRTHNFKTDVELSTKSSASEVTLPKDVLINENEANTSMKNKEKPAKTTSNGPNESFPNVNFMNPEQKESSLLGKDPDKSK